MPLARAARQGRLRRGRPPLSRDRAPAEARAAKKRPTNDSTGEPFDDVFGVNLVGFVIARERVHDEIDAAAEGELTLADAAWDQGIERPAVGVARPGRR